MKASFRDIPLKPIYAIYVGDTPIKSVWKGDKKIWPDNSQRITRIWLDIAALTETQQIYWNHALQHIDAGASASSFIRLTASRAYNINRTYGNFALATHEGNGCISFPAGSGPLASEVVAGKKVKLHLVMPSMKSASVGGWHHADVSVSESGEFPNVPPNTLVRTYWTKGQKKVNTGNAVVVTSLPSGQTLINFAQRSYGRGRWTEDRECGYISPVTSDTTLRVTCTPERPRGSWGAYLVYPAFDITLTPTILRTETITIES